MPPPRRLPYKMERLLSCFLEWLALIVSVITLLTRTIPNHRQRVLFLLAAMYFFVLSGFWRIHIERGQVYVFHLLLLSAGANLCLRYNLNSWTGGILFGLAALMRLNYLCDKGFPLSCSCASGRPAWGPL